MEKYKLLFAVDIRTTDKGYPLATLHFVHTHAHQSPDIIATKNKNRERILKINTSLSNCVLCTTCLRWLYPSIQWPLISYWTLICNICLSFRNSDKLFDIKPSAKNQFHTVNKCQPDAFHETAGKRKYSIVRTHYSYIYRFVISSKYIREYDH